MRNQKISALTCFVETADLGQCPVRKMWFYENMFKAFLLFITSALLCGTLDGMDSIEGNCNDVIRLPCKATSRTNKYRYSMWYKVIKQERIAIIKKKNYNISTYNNYSASLGDKETLVLHSVNPLDSGVYECYLAADVGGQNVESSVRLNISECTYLTTLRPTTAPCHELQLPVSWVLLGFSLISLVKIILCIVSVGVCNQVVFKRIQRKQEVRGIKRGTRSSWKN
nr:uncharacterized protein LOC129414397 isoform X3 [Misgurnus anguillicaudatus]XP_055024418.1 uncharacterized protein LOC129414397 isoform X3 [Misgurnus anguillicaudatus]